SMGHNVLAIDLVIEHVKRARSSLAIQLDLKFPNLTRCCQTHRQSPPLPSFTSTPEVRAFPPPALPGLIGRMALSDSQPGRRPFWRRSGRDSRPDPSLPHSLQIAFPPCRAHYPGGPVQAPVG